MRHDSVICERYDLVVRERWLITRMCAKWLSHLWDMAQSYARDDSSHVCEWNDLVIYETRRSHTRRHDSVVREMWLITRMCAKWFSHLVFSHLWDMSKKSCHISHGISQVPWRVSCVTWRVSCVTWRVSCVTWRVSYVRYDVCHISLVCDE